MASIKMRTPKGRVQLLAGPLAPNRKGISNPIKLREIMTQMHSTRQVRIIRDIELQKQLGTVAQREPTRGLDSKLPPKNALGQNIAAILSFRNRNCGEIVSLGALRPCVEQR